MLLLVLGFMMTVSAALFIDFPDLVRALRTNDQDRWFTLGSPPEHAFSKSLGVFSWVLNHGFEQSSSKEVVFLGAQAYKKAITAKYMCLAGISLVIAGFALALSGF